MVQKSLKTPLRNIKMAPKDFFKKSSILSFKDSTQPVHGCCKIHPTPLFKYFFFKTKFLQVESSVIYAMPTGDFA